MNVMDVKSAVSNWKDMMAHKLVYAKNVDMTAAYKKANPEATLVAIRTHIVCKSKSGYEGFEAVQQGRTDGRLPANNPGRNGLIHKEGEDPWIWENKFGRNVFVTFKAGKSSEAIFLLNGVQVDPNDLIRDGVTTQSKLFGSPSKRDTAQEATDRVEWSCTNPDLMIDVDKNKAYSIAGAGEVIFTFDGKGWKIFNVNKNSHNWTDDMEWYGISISGTPEIGDEINLHKPKAVPQCLNFLVDNIQEFL